MDASNSQPDFVRFSDNNQKDFRNRRGQPNFRYNNQFRGRNRKMPTMTQNRTRSEPYANSFASRSIGGFGAFRGGGQRGRFQSHRVSTFNNMVNNSPTSIFAEKHQVIIISISFSEFRISWPASTKGELNTSLFPYEHD